MIRIRSYAELLQLHTIRDRYEYLKLDGQVGMETFGFNRYLNQRFYGSDEWKRIRRKVILRDDGYDLGIKDYPCSGRLIVHHINPITEEDLVQGRECVFDLNNLILCSFDTHNAIHYGDSRLISQEPIERRPNDTCPWR